MLRLLTACRTAAESEHEPGTYTYRTTRGESGNQGEFRSFFSHCLQKLGVLDPHKGGEIVLEG